jgi:hypothetical protein
MASSVGKRSPLGSTPRTAVRILVLVGALAAAQFGLYALYQDSALAVFGQGSPLFLFLLVLLSGWVERRTGASLVAAVLPVLPIYVHFVHYFHVGQVSGAPYPQALAEAVPFGVGVGLLVGVLGRLVAHLARRYENRFDG